MLALVCTINSLLLLYLGWMARRYFAVEEDRSRHLLPMPVAVEPAARTGSFGALRTAFRCGREWFDRKPMQP